MTAKKSKQWVIKDNQKNFLFVYGEKNHWNHKACMGTLYTHKDAVKTIKSLRSKNKSTLCVVDAFEEMRNESLMKY